MKILVVCQYYYPERFRINDICETLVELGNEVTVLTGLPNYQMGSIPNEYKYGKKRHETINGVEVIRCFEIARTKGVLNRFLNYYSFVVSSCLKVLSISKKYDVVFVNQLSPVMMANAGVLFKKIHKIKLVLYCLDLWPVSLETGGIKRNSLIYRYYKKISEKLYKQADKILVTSYSFIEYMRNELNLKNDIEYLPQYAEDIFNADLLKKEPNGVYDFGFAGNIGKLQSVETIIEAAMLLKNRSDIKFHIVGDGVSLKKCCKLAEGLDNVVFYGSLPLSEMPEFYKKMDVMLVTLVDNDVLNTVMPGKVQSYMSSGKPVIAAVNGETKIVVEKAQCGFCGEPENAQMLKDNILKYIECQNKGWLAKNSSEFYAENFSKDNFISELQKKLKY